MQKNKNSFRAAFVAGITIMTIGQAQNAEATFSMNVYQDGANVVGVGSGTINLAGLTLALDSSGGGLVWGNFQGGGSAIGLGVIQVSDVSGYQTINGPHNFATGGLYSASFGSGDVVAITPGANGGLIFVPKGYVSGSALSDTSTWNNTTIAGLGLILGSYTYTWGSGATADSFNLNVGTPPAPPSVGAVPEPSTFLAGAVLMLPLGVSALRMLRRKQVA
jgi:hypothetical protein